MTGNLYSFMPVIILSTSVIILLLVSAFRQSMAVSLVISLIALLAAAFFTQSWATPQSLFFDTIHLDPFARMTALICIGIGVISCLLAMNYLPRLHIGSGDVFFILILTGVIGMIMMAAANDLMVMFVNLELMSISTYVLCGVNRASALSTESSLKYFITGGVSSAIMLFGIALLYGAFGTTNLSRIAEAAISNPKPALSVFHLFAAAFLLAGLFFKTGVFPFHAWMPDVYQGAPTPVTGFMAAGVRAAAVTVLIRIFVDVLAPYGVHWTSIMWWGAVLTMTLGNLSALLQNNVKRMLGFSSIAHAGYLLVGFVGLSSANLLGAEAIIYYLIAYSVMSLGIFAVIGQIEGASETNLDFNDYRGLGLKYPLVGIAVSIFLLSLTGVPPFAGFFGKYSLFAAAVKNGYVGLAVIGVLNSLVSAFYYFKLMVNMYMREPDVATSVSYQKAPLATFAIVGCAFLTLWFGLGPFSITSIIPSANDLWQAITNGISVLNTGL